MRNKTVSMATRHTLNGFWVGVDVAAAYMHFVPSIVDNRYNLTHTHLHAHDIAWTHV